MDTPELKDVLAEAGLSPYQVEAYVTVLELGSASATDVAEASQVPDPRIYDVLRDLESDGYVETYEQDSLHVRAHDPADVLADLRTRAEQFAAAAEEIEERWSQPSMDDHEVSVVKRFETVLERARETIRTADNQVQVSVTSEQFEQLAPALEAAYEAGAEVKVSLNTAPDGDWSLPDAEAFEDACTEARHRPLPAPFVALADRSHTCFAPHTDAVDQYGVLVRDHAHAYVFHWFFQTCLWDVYEPIYSTRADDPRVTYTDIRECVRSVEPHLEDDAEVVARVQGYDTQTGEPVEVRGRLLETHYGGIATASDEEIPLAWLAGQVNVTLGAGEETVTVGGWGAMLEDVEAVTITIEDVAGSPEPRRNAQ